METTSYAISQKLEKAGFGGFKGSFGFRDFYYNTDKQLRHVNQERYCDSNTLIDCFSYDFETIWEALPKYLIPDRLEEYYLTLYFEIGDMDFRILYRSNYGGLYFTVKRVKGESLADMAARLLLDLHKHGKLEIK